MLATVWSLTRTHCRSTTRPPYRPNAPRISASRTYADAMITHAQHPVQERPSLALASTNLDPVLSVVAPAFNEAECLPEFFDHVRAVMDELGDPWELVLVNDGSRDATLGVMRHLR